MDVEVLFWIAVALFYLFSRVLGGRKKTQKPTRSTPDRSDHGRTAPGMKSPQLELEEALSEIRRALGYPQEKPAQPETRVPKDVAGRPDMEPGVPAPARRPTPRTASPTGSTDSERTRRDQWERAARGSRDQEELERQRELLDRAQAVSRRERARRTRHTLEVEALDSHPLEASFTEEESFERVGQHAHARIRRRDARQDAPTTGRGSELWNRLQSPDGLREAFILKEILDRPLSMRRGIR